MFSFQFLLSLLFGFLKLLLLLLLLVLLLLLLDLEIILHLLNDVAFAVTLIVNAGLLVQERVLVVGVQHFFEQFLPLFKVPILHNLVRFVA